MKKSLLWVMTAILTISGTVATLTSCASNDDNAVVTPSGPMKSAPSSASPSPAMRLLAISLLT